MCMMHFKCAAPNNTIKIHLKINARSNVVENKIKIVRKFMRLTCKTFDHIIICTKREIICDLFLQPLG